MSSNPNSEGTYSRRSVLRRSGTAVAALSVGGTAVVGTVSADFNGYDHKLRVESDGGSGTFRCVINYYDQVGAYETENVESSDVVEEYGDSLRVEFNVSSGYFSPGYDIIRWDNSYEMCIQEYECSNVDAYIDGSYQSCGTPCINL